MAKEKNNNSSKSLVMILITGITLVAVTLCWFAIMNKASMAEKQKGKVVNETSKIASILYGADKTGKIAITPDEITNYKQVSESIIKLENMFPGAEYTYLAKFPKATAGQKIILTLEDVNNVYPGNLASVVEVSYRVETDKAGEIMLEENTVNLKVGDNALINYKVPAKDEYYVYFSFKIKENAELDKANMTIEITNVNAVLSD